MLVPDPARTREILLKRVKRLLRLEYQKADDQSELTLSIIPFLNSLGSSALIGGAIRDVARAGRQGFSSDLDFVIYDSDRDEFANKMRLYDGVKNKFGGYRLRCFQWKVDVWHIDDTWAKTAGFSSVSKPGDLLQCTFFDWDSIVYELNTGKLIFPADYLEKLQLNIMDIQLEANPNPIGALVRALRRAALWRVKFGRKLTAFCKRLLQETSWDEAVALDSRAFSTSVLRYLDRERLLERLAISSCSAVGDVTLPVPDWVSQPWLPLANESSCKPPGDAARILMVKPVSKLESGTAPIVRSKLPRSRLERRLRFQFRCRNSQKHAASIGPRFARIGEPSLYTI